MRRKIRIVFRRWLPLAFLATAICGLICLTNQQNLRQSANDPQIQMAEDTALKLSTGQTLPIHFDDKIDPSLSLAPFVITYDQAGKVVNSNVQIGNQVPDLPKGVLDYTKVKGEDRFTWQTEEGVRIASVVTYYKGASSGFVLAGRSLRETEIREDQLMWEVLSIWIFSLSGLLFLCILRTRFME